MKTSKIIEIIEAYAPKSISDEYCKRFGKYDNSGLNIGGQEMEIKKMLVVVDLLSEDIDFAIENDIHFIWCHHPYIYGKISCIDVGNIKGKQIEKIIKNNITIYSSHLSLDMAVDGIDDTLAKALGGEIYDSHVKLSYGSYGKISKIDSTFEKMKVKVEKMYGQVQMVFGREKISKMASFCGSGLGEEEFIFAQKSGVDTIFSSDIPHHLMVLSKENKINLFALPHGYSEFLAMKEITKKIDFKLVEIFYQKGKILHQ